jgi:putative membrane protein
MRGILHLIRRDLRHSVMNVMAIIVMFGLVVIPSLFTWFNVLASWDPFGNTKTSPSRSPRPTRATRATSFRSA